MEVSLTFVTIVGCLIATIGCAYSAIVFDKRAGGEPCMGSIISMLMGLPFFGSLCYLMICIMEKIGESI
jgi:hypothetical protein